jgi:modulator of FtsH protease HflK
MSHGPIDIGRRGPGFTPNPDVLLRLIPVALSAIVLGWISTGIYTLPAGTAAVVTQSGKVHVESRAGYHLANPIGIAGSQVLKVRMNTPEIVEFGFRTKKPAADGNPAQYNEVPDEAEDLTADGGFIHAEVVIQLLPTDPYKWVYNTARRTDLVRNITASTMVHGFGRQSLEEGLKGTVQASVAAQIKEELDTFLTLRDTGARVQSVNLQNVSAPAKVRTAYDDVAKARAQAQAAVQEAQQDQQAKIAAAKGQAASDKADADQYASTTVGQAKGDAQKFSQWYQEYSKNPGLANSKLFWESMDKMLARDGVQIYLMDEKGNTLRYLPLQ